MTGFGLVAVMLLLVPHTPLGWRLLYIAALPPLVLVTWLRRNLRETQAFTVAQETDRVQSSFWPSVDAVHRPLLWRITVVLGTHGMLATPIFFYAAELAQDGYGWEGLFTVIVLATGPASLAGYAAGGRLSDRVGRRPVVIGSSFVVAVGVVAIFSEQRSLFPVGFFLVAGADAALAAVRPVYLSELFPTEVRATLLAFVFSVVVAAGSVGLVVVGALDGHREHPHRSSVGSWPRCSAALVGSVGCPRPWGPTSSASPSTAGVDAHNLGGLVSEIMRMSDGVEWVLHACTVLATLPSDQALSAARLAEFHGVPPAYLAKHLQAAAAAGIVESLPGPRGGYRLRSATG